MGIKLTDLCKSSKCSQMLNHFLSPNPRDFKSQKLFSDYKSFMYWLSIVALNIIRYYVFFFFLVSRVHAQVYLCVYCDIDCSLGLAQATAELAVPQPLSDLLLKYFSGKTLGFTCILMFSFKFFFILSGPPFCSPQALLSRTRGTCFVNFSYFCWLNLWVLVCIAVSQIS